MENRLTLKEIANIYKTSKSNINNIKRKVKWKYITKEYNFPRKRGVK